MRLLVVSGIEVALAPVTSVISLTTPVDLPASVSISRTRQEQTDSHFPSSLLVTKLNPPRTTYKYSFSPKFSPPFPFLSQTTTHSSSLPEALSTSASLLTISQSIASPRLALPNSNSSTIIRAQFTMKLNSIILASVATMLSGASAHIMDLSNIVQGQRNFSITIC